MYSLLKSDYLLYLLYIVSHIESESYKVDTVLEK